MVNICAVIHPTRGKLDQKTRERPPLTPIYFLAPED
jgi:hypothetical protein